MLKMHHNLLFSFEPNVKENECGVLQHKGVQQLFKSPSMINSTFHFMLSNSGELQPVVMLTWLSCEAWKESDGQQMRAPSEQV